MIKRGGELPVMPQLWLRAKPRLYLKGFWNRKNRPETRRIAPKTACFERQDLAFTVFVLTMIAP
jgi:hypothetical protein